MYKFHPQVKNFHNFAKEEKIHKFTLYKKEKVLYNNKVRNARHMYTIHSLHFDMRH